MIIKHKDVADLTDTEYRACYRANYGWDGYMMDELIRLRGIRGGIAIMLWDGPEDTIRSLKGWALLSPAKQYGTMAVTRYATTKVKYSAQFWVKRQHRRKGYGTMLMEEVKKYDPRPHVLPHDDASSELFSSFNVYVSQQDKHWLKKKPKRDRVPV